MKSQSPPIIPLKERNGHFLTVADHSKDAANNSFPLHMHILHQDVESFSPPVESGLDL